SWATNDDSSVVVAGLDDDQRAVVHGVDQAMLLVDAAGPVAGEVSAEPFRLAGANARIPAGLDDQAVDPVEDLTVTGPADVVVPAVGSEGDLHSRNSCC